MSLYGLIVGIAIVIGLEYFQKQINKKYFPYFLIIVSLLGARTYHVIEQWTYYSQNPTQILNTRAGGVSIIGAIIAGLLYTLIYSKFTHTSFLKIINSITPILPLCQATGRLGNFVNHENPIWWPEAILDVGLYFFIRRYPKYPTAKYLIGYGLIRLIIEFWRHDTWVSGSIRIGQLFSVLFIIIGLFLYQNNYTKICNLIKSLSSGKKQS